MLQKYPNDLDDDSYRKNLNTLLIKATFFRLKLNCHAVETIRALHIWLRSILVHAYFIG